MSLPPQQQHQPEKPHEKQAHPPIRDFSYCLTSELDLFVRVKISSLDGLLPLEKEEQACCQETSRFDYYVTTQIWAQNAPVTPLLQTSYRSADREENLQPASAGAGGASGEGDGHHHFTWNEILTFPIKYRDLTPDAQIVFHLWAPHAFPATSSSSDRLGHLHQDRLVGGTTLPFLGKRKTLCRGRQRLQVHLHELGDGCMESRTLAKRDADSSDHAALQKIEKSIKKFYRGDVPKLEWLDQHILPKLEALRTSLHRATSTLFLYIEMPNFDFPYLFHEKEYAPPIRQHITKANKDLMVVDDPEIGRQHNVVEWKHRRLVRSTRTGPLDRDMKPNARIRDELRMILRYPSTKTLSSHEKDLLWKFRFSLTKDKKAVTKFLKAVDFSNPAEAAQATQTLLPLWVEIDVEDALELLGASFENEKVRGFAVSQLKKDLMLYLFQLVQALKFERCFLAAQSLDDPSASTASLFTREREDTAASSSTGSVNAPAAAAAAGRPLGGTAQSPLVTFLIQRAVANPILGNFFYWYLMVEWEDRALGKMFGSVCHQFLETLQKTAGGEDVRKTLMRQGELVTTLSKIILKLQESLRKSGYVSIDPLTFVLDPKYVMIGIASDDAMVMKSSLAPLRLRVQCTHGQYLVMFKNGDDLRQDQLVIQLFTLMARLFKNENLDLKLTPYAVLATGNDHGFIQFVHSATLASILQDYNGNLQAYLRTHNPDPEAVDTFGIHPMAMDAYIRSCAGYCVMTYLLGIGDRHLDNLMLTPGGRLFHIDFGFILGKDPKPFPPPMKLCREMVDAMGGMSSPHFARFRSYCYIAFNILRKSANLILNLFTLMVDANSPIRDLRSESDKVVSKVQEKFRLDLSDEEAIRFFDGLITDSVSALFPQVIETIHKWAQYWRK